MDNDRSGCNGLDEATDNSSADTGDVGHEASIHIDSVADIGSLNFATLTNKDIYKFLFADVDLAYEFYKAFATLHGFSIRRNRLEKNVHGDVVRRTFVCSAAGFRNPALLRLDKRKKAPKSVTRYGWKAEMCIGLGQCGRWMVTLFHNEHNHDLLGGRYGVLHRSQRGMTEVDVEEMNCMSDVGIPTPQVYQYCAKLAGGYDMVGFCKREMYNNIRKSRQPRDGYSSNVILYLTELAKTDRGLFWKYTIDTNNRIQRLFWCDGSCRYDYHVFGDVLTFDATYGKNKYSCPIVVFSGVNHHNNTCVFAIAVVSDETEDTYIWGLNQFLDAMGGKAPRSVITDGDLSIRNAIHAVFPRAHHRLCAWHLIRNASKNVKNDNFTQLFRRCLLGDYEIRRFEKKWKDGVKACGVERHQWVLDIYEKKEMWSAAYMRGHFFAGFRTTSHCEALHAQLAKFIGYRNDLTELLQHFQRAINSMRNTEVEADFNSMNGVPVL